MFHEFPAPRGRRLTTVNSRLLSANCGRRVLPVVRPVFARGIGNGRLAGIHWLRLARLRPLVNPQVDCGEARRFWRPLPHSRSGWGHCAAGELPLGARGLRVSAGLARWRSGYAEDCKSLHAGSIPARASTSRFRHCGQAARRLWAAWSAALAQLVEHIIRNDGATGSSPVSGTTHSRNRPMSSLSGLAGSRGAPFRGITRVDHSA